MPFLSRLKSLLDSEQKDNDNLNENPNFVTKERRIKNMLLLLQKAHVQVSVIFDDHEEFTSRILSVSNKGLILDQFSSQIAHRKVQSNTPVQIKAKYHAVPFDFSSKVINKVNNSGYLIEFPHKVYHPQKRSFFRIPLSLVGNYRFHGAVKFSENVLSGYIYDISFGGLSIACTSQVYVKKDDLLSPASLMLGEGIIVNTDLHVCSVKRTDPDSPLRLGCKFVNLKGEEKKLIHQFIVQCERDRAKVDNS